MKVEIKRIEYPEWTCELCGAKYLNEPKAVECEAKKVTWDKGVVVGDIVKIVDASKLVAGDGVGQTAKVTRVFVIKYDDWPRKYHHTVAIQVDLIESWGSRILTFDQYEVV